MMRSTFPQGIPRFLDARQTELQLFRGGARFHDVVSGSPQQESALSRWRWCHAALKLLAAQKRLDQPSEIGLPQVYLNHFFRFGRPAKKILVVVQYILA